MSGVVIVGVILSLMFLVAFSNWFYHLIAGMNALIIEDVFASYRIFGWGLGAIIFMGTVFWVNAMVQECPTPEADREGLFTYLDCSVYDWAKQKTALGPLLPGPRDVLVDPASEPEEEAPTYPG